LKDRPLIASTRRAGRIREYAMLSLLFIVPLAMRLAATFILPGEPEADGYTHMLEAGGIAERISGGTFELRNLHGNWLPLGKLSCGLLIVVFGHAYWVCRIVSVLAGSAACVLVWAAARRAFDSEFAAWASWFLLLTAPWHLLYSGLGMLEASFGMCIAASVYLLMRSSKDNRLFLVSCMVMGAACLIRYEGWILAPLLWLIGAFQRRASLPVLAAGGLAFTIPVAWWHWLNYVVTGNPFYHLEFGRRYFEDFYRSSRKGGFHRPCGTSTPSGPRRVRPSSCCAASGWPSCCSGGESGAMPPRSGCSSWHTSDSLSTHTLLERPNRTRGTGCPRCR
jgi:hypothetical protein